MGSALTGFEPTMWRRLSNLSKYQNEQGYFMGPAHWQPQVDNTPGALVHEESSTLNARITVRQHGYFRALRLDDTLHSLVITEPDVSMRKIAVVDKVPFAYVRTMAATAAAFGRLTGAWPGDRGPGSRGNLAVCLGVGGGSLPALLAHHYPQTLIQAVEIDPAIIDVARRYMSLSAPMLALKKNLLVQQGDARATILDLLQEGAAPPEVIMLDCYDAGGTIPEDLSGATFLGVCVEVLKPDGLLLANLFNNKVGSHARLRFAHYAVQMQAIMGRGSIYSVKAVNQEVNVILIGVKAAADGGEDRQPFRRQEIIKAAQEAGKEAGFRFPAADELIDLFHVHADSVATFHETIA